MVTEKKSRRLLWLLFLLLPLAMAGALSVGAAGLTPDDLFRLLISPESSVEKTILFRIRLPRSVLALAAGGALSLSGVLLQGLFRNPLVAPYTLGISGGAALGVALAIVTGLASLVALALPLAGFLGALAVVFVIALLSSNRRLRDTHAMLLMGVMISFMASSLFMLVTALSKSEDLSGIIFWIMGSLDEPNLTLVYGLAAISLLGLLIAYGFTNDLNALALGQQEAHHLGVNVDKVRIRLFLLASLLTGCTVAVTGVIGFVGLVVPHFVRLLVGVHHRYVLAASFMAGALFLLLCDVLARTIIAPLEMPIGVITGLVGGSLFIVALLQRKGMP